MLLGESKEDELNGHKTNTQQDQQFSWGASHFVEIISVNEICFTFFPGVLKIIYSSEVKMGEAISSYILSKTSI